MVPDHLAEGGGERGRGRVRLARARRVRLSRGRVQRRSFGRRRRTRETAPRRARKPRRRRTRRWGRGRRRTRRRGPRRRFGQHPVRRLGRRLRVKSSAVCFSIQPFRVELPKPYPPGARRGLWFAFAEVGPNARGSGEGASREQVWRCVRSCQPRDCSSAASPSSKSREAFAEEDRGTLHRGFLCVAVVVVVARFRVHLRVDEFLEGKILVVLDLGGASERVSSRAIRPVAEGRSRPLLAVRRSVRGGRGEHVALHEHASLRASRGEERREERRERDEGGRARRGHGVRRVGLWGDRE